MADKSNPVYARLKEFITQKMEAHQAPGVVVGIFQKGETAVFPFGITNIEHPLSVTDTTLFQVGSISKTFTAMIMMRLVELGQLDLDASVQTYLPTFRVADEDVSARATIRHLLTHTAGWAGDVFEDTGEGDDAAARYVALMADLEQLAPLGTTYSYNNASFYLAGAVIEAITKKPFAAVLQEMVLDPLGMSHSFLKPQDVITHRFAVGHHNGQVARPWALPRAVYPVGGLVTAVADLLRYAQFQMGDGTTPDGLQLLSPDSLASLHTIQAEIWGEKEAIGLSWFINEVDGTTVWSHGGGTKGQVSYLFIVPEHHFAAVIVTNSEMGHHITHPTYRWLLREALGLDAPEPQAIPSKLEDLAEFVGEYKRPFADLTLSIQNDKLMMQVTSKQGFPSRSDKPSPAPPPMPLAFCEPDRLIVTEGAWKGSLVDVIRHPDGTVGWLRAGRLHRRVS